jgi:hypothetical protein
LQEGDKEVLFKFAVMPTGNCDHVAKVLEGTYGFFGKPIPCVMLTNE